MLKWLLDTLLPPVARKPAEPPVRDDSWPHFYQCYGWALWLGVDCEGVVGAFATENGGPVPTSMTLDPPINLNDMWARVLELPGGRPVLGGFNRFNADEEDLPPLAERGLVVYQWGEDSNLARRSGHRFARVIMPERPLRAEELPVDLGACARLATVPVEFAATPFLDAAGLLPTVRDQQSWYHARGAEVLRRTVRELDAAVGGAVPSSEQVRREIELALAEMQSGWPSPAILERIHDAAVSWPYDHPVRSRLVPAIRAIGLYAEPAYRRTAERRNARKVAEGIDGDSTD